MRFFHGTSFMSLPAVLAMLWAAPALAEGGPKLTVLPYQPIARQASPELCTQITTLITNELGGNDTFTMMTAESGQEGGDTGPSSENQKAEAAAKAALDKGLTLAQGGNKQVKKLKFDPAIKTLGAALAQFDNAAAAVTDVAPISQAHVDLAVAFWKRGLEDEAMAEMAAAARMDPEMKPDAKEYWPLFLRVYDQQWRKALRAPRGKVRVEATVPGAEVFLDGKSAGAAPLMLANVVPGKHFLRVAKEGGGVFGTLLEVKPDATVEVTADLGGTKAGGGGLGPVAHAINDNLMDEAALKAARDLGKKAGADFVVFGGIKKGETTISVASFMVKVADGKAARLVDLDVDLDLLSASVETFKLEEDVAERTKAFGELLPAGATPVIRGMAGQETAGSGISEVDVGPAVPDAKAGKDPGQVADAGDPDRGRTIAGAEGDEAKPRTKRPSLDGKPVRDDSYKAKTPFYLNPLFIVPVVAVAGVGALLVVGLVVGGGVGGGLGAAYLLAPSRSATVTTTWPN
jgi:hypothetical protein